MTNALLLRRRGMMMAQQGGLPYDAEIEYLGFTGTQYIDTGVPADTVNVEASAKIRINSSNDIYGILAAYDVATGIRFYLLDYNNGFIYTCKFSGIFTWANTARLSYADTTSFRTYSSAQTSSSVTITRVETQVTTTVGVSSSSTSGINYSLGARNYSTGSIERIFHGDIAAVWIKQNGVYVRDFIPVRVGTVGYMYDRVSGQLFGNQGTGAFVIGPDVQ